MHGRPYRSPSTFIVLGTTMSDTTPEPFGYTIKEWMIRSHMGRTATYAAIADGRLEAVKNGKRTLIVAASGNRFLESLPRAVIAGKQAA